MQFSTGHPVVDAVGQLHFSGNIVHHSWYRHVRYTNKRGEFTDPLAVILLADMVNEFYVKDDQGDVVSISTDWRDSYIVISPDIWDYWTKKFCATQKVLKESLTVLVNTGFLILLPSLMEEEVARLLQDKQPQKLSPYHRALSRCAWCQSKTNALHKHHFPVPHSRGGTETVGICPNCHSEFHSLTGAMIIQLTSKAFDVGQEEVGHE